MGDITLFQQRIETAQVKYSAIVSEKHFNHLQHSSQAMFVMQCIKNNPSLLDCNPDSIMDAMYNAAALGVSMCPNLAYVYLVPYNNEVTLAFGYKCMIHLAMRDPNVVNVTVTLVHENDPVFEWVSEVALPNHKRNPMHSAQERGKVIGGYSTITYQNGLMTCEAMNMEEINQARTSSKAPNSPAWRDYTGQMYKKVILKRGLGMQLAKSPNMDLSDAIAADNYVEGYTTKDGRSLTDAEKNTPEFKDSIVGEQQLNCIDNEQQKILQDIINSGEQTAMKRQVTRLFKAYGLNSLADLNADLFTSVCTKFQKFNHDTATIING